MADWITRHLMQPIHLFHNDAEWNLQQHSHRDYLTAALHALSLLVPKGNVTSWPPWAAISLLKSTGELVRWDWPVAFPGGQGEKPLGELVPEELGDVMDLVYDAARRLPTKVATLREAVRELWHGILERAQEAKKEQGRCLRQRHARSTGQRTSKSPA